LENSNLKKQPKIENTKIDQFEDGNPSVRTHKKKDKMSNISVPNNQNPPVAPAAEVPTEAPAKAPQGLPSALISSDKARLLKEIQCAEESPPQKGNDNAAPVNVAQFLTYYQAPATGNGPPEAVNVKLDNFSSFQLRKLCQHVGITSVSSFSKFECRRRLAIVASVHASIEGSSIIETASKAMKALARMLRYVNAVTHPNNSDMLRSFNDKKDRSDHETGNTPSKYFEAVVDLYNNPTPDVFMDRVLNESNLPFGHEENHLTADPVYEANLRIFDPMDSTEAKKKFKLLWACHRQMKENMTVSGTHASDPMKFVDAAMKKVKGGTSVTRYGLFYFYHRIEMLPGIEDGFAPAMLEHLKGDTVNVNRLFQSSCSTSSRSNKRKGNKEAAQEQLLQIQRDRLNQEVADSKNRYIMEMLKMGDTSPGTRKKLKSLILSYCDIRSNAAVSSSPPEKNNNKGNNNKRFSLVTNGTTSSEDPFALSDSDEDSDI
jgi:hypothetical protein